MRDKIQSLIRKDNLEYEFLPHALEIEETPARPLRRALIWIIFGITCLTLLWSYLGRVDEVAVARGKLIPDGRVQVIQPMETGVIRAIHVREGQEVKKGQLLIELDPTIKDADVESAEKALSTRISDRERLRAELGGHEMNGVKSEFHGLQKKLKEARENEYRAKEESLRLVTVQKESALNGAEAILQKYEKMIVILAEQESAYKKLYENGYSARMEYLERQKEHESARHELEAQKKTVKQAGESYQEANKNLEALRREREKGILSDMVDRERDIISLWGEAVKARKRSELESLRSPVDGTVHGLASYTVGGVLTSAQPAVTIVPHGTPLVIEATAMNQDIGFLKVGQEAEVKLDTFPFQKYGTIKARVAWIGPDALDDEKLGQVYKIKVVMEKLFVTVDGRPIALGPGMSVSVEVKTNQRRIIEFFLSPIIKYATESLTLR